MPKFDYSEWTELSSEITPKSGVPGDLQVKEYEKIQDFDFHIVYSVGKYIYDPRYNNLLILENDYFNILESLNPSGISKKIQQVRRRK